MTITHWVPNKTDDGEEEKMTLLVDYIIDDLEFDGSCNLLYHDCI